MPTNNSVLIIGFDPEFLDFSSPELAPMNLTAEKINAGTAAELERLRGLGYEPEGCFVDLGETAASGSPASRHNAAAARHSLAMSERPMHAIPGAFEKLQQLYAEGEAALNVGDFATAVAKFSEGIAIDDHFRQRYVTMYAQRAFALQRMGENARAIADYGKAIELEPPMNQAQYYFHRGMCHAALPQGIARAIADYTASIALHHDHPGPFHLRGKLLLQVGQWAAAEADFDRLLELRPNPDGYANRAYARLRQGRAADALADARASRELKDDPSTDYLLASIHAVLGHADAMLDAMRLALDAHPGYAADFAGDADIARYHHEPRFTALLAR